MLCERCKIREANIQYTEVINGVKTEHNYCAQCAKELDFGPYSAIFDGEFPLGKLLSGLLGIGEDHKEEKMHQIVCPTCKTSYEEFIKNSRFGCPDCYGVFDLLISDNIKQLQGSDSHTGKRPRYRSAEDGTQELVSAGRAGAGTGHEGEEGMPGKEKGNMPGKAEPNIEEQIRVLQARLQDALLREEYETAALCRDKIKELKEGV